MYYWINKIKFSFTTLALFGRKSYFNVALEKSIIIVKYLIIDFIFNFISSSLILSFNSFICISKVLSLLIFYPKYSSSSSSLIDIKVYFLNDIYGIVYN